MMVLMALKIALLKRDDHIDPHKSCIDWVQGIITKGSCTVAQWIA